MITLDSVVVAAPGQVSSDLAGEVVILSMKHGTYYGLDEVGVQVWRLLQQPRQVAAIRDAILAEYDVSLEECEHDLLALLEELATADLIAIV